MELYTFNQLKGWSNDAIRKAFGGKALGLYQTWKLSLPIPETWFLGIEHFKSSLECAFAKLPDGLFAVRSSAEAEVRIALLAFL